MASEIPVLPEVGSRIVQPGRSVPSFSASTIIRSAARSLIDPVGFWSSSLAQSRTSGEGESRGSPTSGVPPTVSSRLSKRTYPPATAGSTTTWSPSFSVVSRPPVNRTSSSLTYTLTNRRRSLCPSSLASRSRSLRPGWLASRSSISAASVSPVASTAFSPPVYVRRIVGIRTSMAMVLLSACGLGVVVFARLVGDLDLFFRHRAVDDPVGPELHRTVAIPVLAGRDEHVVRARLVRQADVGAAGVGLGRGVRVVDHHRLLVLGPHL